MLFLFNHLYRRKIIYTTVKKTLINLKWSLGKKTFHNPD